MAALHVVSLFSHLVNAWAWLKMKHQVSQSMLITLYQHWISLFYGHGYHVIYLTCWQIDQELYITNKVKRRIKGRRKGHVLKVLFFLLLLSGDIQLNPGPSNNINLGLSVDLRSEGCLQWALVDTHGVVEVVRASTGSFMEFKQNSVIGGTAEVSGEQGSFVCISTGDYGKCLAKTRPQLCSSYWTSTYKQHA